MAHEPQSESARIVRWLIRKNPAYLLSAALMAVGARLYLAGSNEAAGDIVVILTTLGILQVYELAVTGVVVLLHRTRRSPEDQPSLLLVATLFWSGPLAAAMEMTAVDVQLGLYVAIGACVIALGEMHGVQRLMGLRLSIPARVVGVASVLLPAGAPTLLRSHVSSEGIHALLLYGLWWLLAIISLIGLGVWRANGRDACGVGRSRRSVGLRGETMWLLAVLGATVLHLVGMDHAFYCDAALFYASPLIVAAALLGFTYPARTGVERAISVGVCGVLPGVAILLTVLPAGRHVPMYLLPVWLRDPTLAVSVVAAVVWWIGFLKHRHALFLHAGSAACAVALLCAVSMTGVPDVAHEAIREGRLHSQTAAAIALYLAGGYFAATACWFRSRNGAMVAIGIQFIATTTWLLGRSSADTFVMGLSAGWGLIAVYYIAVRRPGVALMIFAFALLTLATWGHDFNEDLAWYARSNAVVMVAAIYVIARVERQPRPWIHGAIAAAAHLLFYGGRLIGASSSPPALIVVCGSFLLLVIGALISWHKMPLLGQRSTPSTPSHDIGVEKRQV